MFPPLQWLSFSHTAAGAVVYVSLVPDPKVERLSHVPLFKGLSKRDLEFLASRIDEVTLKPDQTVIREGQPTDAFFIVISGNVKVTRSGKPAARLGPGEFFGEIGMLDQGPATATVITDGPVDAMVLSHAQFRDAIKGNDGLAMQVIAAMAQRLRANALA
jgi:CRP/FNR family transcriptional regulator, cyclic AMP receptor protein